MEAHVFTPVQQWEIAFIYAFACTFNSQQEKAPSFYKLPDFSPQELEDDVQKPQSELIHKIICACLGNILNRKNPIESFKNAFQQLITDKMKTFEIDLQINPLLKENFYALDIDIKLYLLHSLIDWQLQDSQAVRSIIEFYGNHTPRNKPNPIKANPIGMDSKKRSYWQFGESCWVWREKIGSKTGLEWETVCRNRQDLENLVATLSPSSRYEKALIKLIEEDLYELAEKEQQKKLRKERAELRKAIPPEISITKTQLRSRGANRVRYNFDDYDALFQEDNDDEYEEELEKKTIEKHKPAPTRWSSRLNKNSGRYESEDEDMISIDNNEIDVMDTTPSQSEMDMSSPPSIMDITPSDVAMDTSRSQSIISNMDTTMTQPQSVMEY